MTLIAYFDDSGTHNDSDVILIAGLVATAEEWSGVGVAWSAVLAEHGVKRFHRFDCEAGVGEFDLWPRARRDLLYHDLRATLSGVLMRSSHVIYRRDWNEIVEGQFSDVARTIGSPYRIVLSECIQKTVLWARDARPADERLIFLFDRRPQNTVHESILGELYAEHPWWKPWIERFNFVSGQDHPLLQTADLYAHDLYQNHKARLRNPKGFKIGSHLAAMKGLIRDQRSGHLDRAWLGKYCANLSADMQRAGLLTRRWARQGAS